MKYTGDTQAQHTITFTVKSKEAKDKIIADYTKAEYT